VGCGLCGSVTIAGRKGVVDAPGRALPRWPLAHSRPRCRLRQVREQRVVGSGTKRRTNRVEPACSLSTPPQASTASPKTGRGIAPAGPQRDHLVHLRAAPEGVADLVVGRAEAPRRLKGAEAAHGLVAPLEAPVILLQPVVQVLAAAMGHPLAQDLADGARVGVVPAGGRLPGLS